MNVKEFREKVAALQAERANLEGEAREAKTREINDLTATFNAEIAAAKAERETASANKKSVVAQIREALNEQKRSITVQGYTASGSTVAGVHNQVIEEKIQGILDPLYTNSVLSKLGVRWFAGLPMGDVKVPVMGKNSVAWEAEIGAADPSQPTFTAVTLKPNRISAYVDISKQLIMQDNIGAEQAIMNDLAKAVGDKLEATIFGYGAASNCPKGMFYDTTTSAARSLTSANTFAEVIALEGTLEDACVNLANCKYLLSPKAKATLRTMATNGNGSPRVLTAGTIDGTPCEVSANVVDSADTTNGAYIYGDWSNLAVGSWGNVEITIDPYTQAANGCIRLVVNAYFDAKVLRESCFVYGDTRN